MKFNVQRTATYTLEKDSIELFKEKMLEYLEDEMYEDETLKENEKFPYTIEDIPDYIVGDAISDAIQYAFEEPNYSDSGFVFNDYFGTVFIGNMEDDVSDCVYEAVANWRTEMEV